MADNCSFNSDKSTPAQRIESRKRTEFRRKMISIAVMIGVVACFVYFIIPTMFIILGTMWPEKFPGLSALETLNTNINSAVGIVGLVLAIYSIYYAYETNKVMDSQRAANDAFLGKIDNKLEQVKERVTDVSHTSTEIFTKIDNLSGEKPKSEQESHEQ